jgi:phosphatidylserine/phosphatidylglycerophosphate/cardiolipin synthase-like enzyme
LRHRRKLAGMTWISRLLPLLLVSIVMGCAPRPPAAPMPPPDGGLRLWQDAGVFDAVRLLLGAARTRVWLEMYEFDRPDLEAALLAAHARGADVKVIVDPSVSASIRATRRLAALGMPVRSYPVDDRRHQIDHVKLLLTESEALTGGMNWGRHSERNHDYAIEVRPPPVLDRLEAIFVQDWSISGGAPRPLAPSEGAVAQTAPGQEIRHALLAALRAARHEVMAEIFVLTDPDVSAALAAAHRRGVLVRLLLDPSQEVNRPSYAVLREAGIRVRMYPDPAGGKLHAKAGLFDGRLILGSANWSVSGLSVNHELDLVLDDAAVANSFRMRFEADWASAG